MEQELWSAPWHFFILVLNKGVGSKNQPVCFALMKYKLISFLCPRFRYRPGLLMISVAEHFGKSYFQHINRLIFTVASHYGNSYWKIKRVTASGTFQGYLLGNYKNKRKYFGCSYWKHWHIPRIFEDISEYLGICKNNFAGHTKSSGTFQGYLKIFENI